jgi:hypothetical protein
MGNDIAEVKATPRGMALVFAATVKIQRLKALLNAALCGTPEGMP